MHYSLSLTNMWLNLVRWEQRRAEVNPRYDYLGKKDGCRMFRLSFMSFDNYVSQMLLFADEKNKEIRRVEISSVVPPDTPYNEECPVAKVDVRYECETVRETTFIWRIHAWLEYFDDQCIRSDELTLDLMRVTNARGKDL